ncbi:MAG: hypothetical protein KBT69_09260, partial [Oceanihabitans sp.]|nr:hypothetical protein [Oceanihabitans sp.]
ESEAAIYNFLQAAEFHPENAELEYRLGGLYFLQHETEKGSFHLKNAVRTNPEYAFIIEELFPNVFDKPMVKKLLKLK